ncbi:MAG TPA: ABC transporter permease [Vicinamibacterales bacterium]|nr:ABC transporter permease [Vicinamibacterales bacterium]
MPSMETLWQDLRYAIRTLGKTRGLTTVAILSLALGIGANTTIFTFINGLLLRPPMVHDPERLLEVWQRNTTRGSGIGSDMQLSFPEYEHYRDHNSTFTEMGAFTGETPAMIWNRAGDGETLRAALVSTNFFSILGVQPALGRGFQSEDEHPATAAPVVVLSHAMWEQRLGSDPAIVGKTLTLNGGSYTVVGVAPAAFTGLIVGFSPDVWTPMSMQRAVSPGLDLNERRMHWLLAIGRLKPGVTRQQAAADLAVLGQQLARDFPETNKNLMPDVVPVELVPSPFRGVAGGISAVLMAVVGLVLLIACANVANLLLAKASSRRREVAVRMALGANRRRLVQQLLTESVLIAGIAGAIGLLLSLWAAPLLLSLRPASLAFVVNVSPDTRVLAFTLLASIVTGIVFGLAPALQQSKSNQVENLKDGSAHGGSSRSRLRNALVVAQVTACVVLLVGASLCLRSLLNARSIDPGFDIRNTVAGGLNVQTFGYDQSRGRAFYAELLERVRAVPGVRFASLADHLPLGQIMRMQGVEIDGHEAPRTPSAMRGLPIDMALVGPDYFDAMGISVLSGRSFKNTDDEKAPPVVVINQEMAERFWPRQNPVGQFVTLMGSDGGRTRAEIIGVVKTGKYASLGEDPKSFFYRPLLQEYEPGAQLIVRTAAGAPVIDALRHEVRALDPRMALVGVETLEQHMQLPLFPARAAGLLLGLFGLLALTLAIVGLYGVMSYSVSQRTREIGVRMALGARRIDVVRLILAQGLRLTLTGMAIGVVCSVALTWVLRSVLYGISATDPVSFLAVAIVLTMVAVIASYVPARWATRVDPMRALRTE